MSDGMGRELAYLSSHANNCYFIPNWGNNRQLRDSLSLELHVPNDCPPVFLVNCQDDPIVKYHNSELLDSALTVHHVNHRYIQYKTGGHGFGATDYKGTAECRQWKDEFLIWLRESTW